MKDVFMKYTILLLLPALIVLLNLLLNIFTYFATIEFYYYNDVPLSIFFILSIVITVCVIFIADKKRREIGRGILESIFELPRSNLTILLLLLLFSIFSIAAGQELSKLGGFAEIVKRGEYVLMNHGNVVMILQEKQYLLYKSLEVREWTGSIMLFALVAFCSAFGNEKAINKKKVKG